MGTEPTTTATEPTTSELIETLRADRLWLLSADHEARLDTHEVELEFVADRLRECN